MTQVFLAQKTGITTQHAYEKGSGILDAAKAFVLRPNAPVGDKYGRGPASHYAIAAERGRRAEMLMQNRAKYDSIPIVGPDGKGVAGAMFVDESGRVRITGAGGIRTQINGTIYKEIAAQMRQAEAEADAWLQECIYSEDVWAEFIGTPSVTGKGQWPPGVEGVAKEMGWEGRIDALADYDASFYACTLGAGAGAGPGAKERIAMNLKKAQLILMVRPPDVTYAPIQSHSGVALGQGTQDVKFAAAAGAPTGQVTFTSGASSVGLS